MADIWQDEKLRSLREITFGARVAEEEAAELSTYFVETDQWNRLYRGDIDLVYGAKGSGKSAMFALLLSREDALFDRRILIAGVEDPRGAPVFSQLVADPPSRESQIRALWKLYLVSLVGRQLREWRVSGSQADRVLKELAMAGLLQTGSNLRKLLRATLRYVRMVMRATSVEATLSVDPRTGMPSGVTGRITFREPTPEERTRHGLISIDELFECADRALADADLRVWLVLDRLDVAFADSERLEANALRALFRVYLELRRLDRISLKVFLRSDVWERVTSRGFREASHLTRALTIAWTQESLMHLIVRRLVSNRAIGDRYRVSRSAVLTATHQRRLFYAVCQARRANRSPHGQETFGWVVSLVSDGTGVAEPRELIHLFNAARDVQVRRLETGMEPPPGEVLLDLTAFGEGLREVSRARLEQTIYAEHPRCRPWIERMHGTRTSYVLRNLTSIWSVPEREASRRVEELTSIGVLTQVGTRQAPMYRVPMLYRPALGLLSGIEWVSVDQE